jgi:hypothetical protein
VEVDVPRAETIVVEGVVFRPDMAVQVMVLFEPLDGGRRAAVQAELPLVAGEVNPVSKVLRQQGVQITALHHHELAERPQLYFLHAFAVGTDVELARKVATALDRMNLKRG